MTTQAYCVKCKAKRQMKNEKPVTMKNGRTAISGVCSTCGTKMFKIGGGGTTTTTPSRKTKIAVKQPPKKKQAKAVKQKKK